jgi:hypothetical protein
MHARMRKGQVLRVFQILGSDDGIKLETADAVGLLEAVPVTPTTEIEHKKRRKEKRREKKKDAKKKSAHPSSEPGLSLLVRRKVLAGGDDFGVARVVALQSGHIGHDVLRGQCRVLPGHLAVATPGERRRRRRRIKDKTDGGNAAKRKAVRADQARTNHPVSNNDNKCDNVSLTTDRQSAMQRLKTKKK